MGLPTPRVARWRGCQRGASRTDRVELIVRATQPPFGAARAFNFVYLLAVSLQRAHKPGTIVAAALDSPRPRAARMSIREAQRLRVAATAGRRRRLRDHRARPRVDNRKRVLIAMRIDANHVVQFVCKHPNRSSDS